MGKVIELWLLSCYVRTYFKTFGMELTNFSILGFSVVEVVDVVVEDISSLIGGLWWICGKGRTSLMGGCVDVAK